MHAPTSSWFDHAEFAAWRKKLAKAGDTPLSLAAIPAAAQAFVVAGLLHGTGKAALVTAPGVKGQEEFASDFEAWQEERPTFFFPEAEPAVGDSLPDQNVAAERLALARRIQQGGKTPPLILCTRAGL